MRQGEIWYADLEPVKGSEQSGKRPVVIISGPAMNITLSIVIACPLTSTIKKIKGCIVIQKNEKNNLKRILKFWFCRYVLFLKAGYLKRSAIFRKTR